MMVPLTVGIKRRLWRDAIESDFRPFVIAEAGPVFGIAFPTGHGFARNIKKGQGQITAGIFAGFGIDFGDANQKTYGITIGGHFIPFFKNLGEEDTYFGLDIRFNFLNYKN